MVAIQLKIFTPVGTAINMVAYMKNNWPVTGIPVANMWCAQTMNDKIAILNVKISKQDEAMKKQDGMVNDLKAQVANALFRLDLCEQQRSNDSTIIKGLKQDLTKAKVKGIAGWTTTGVVSAIAIFLGIFFGTK